LASFGFAVADRIKLFRRYLVCESAWVARTTIWALVALQESAGSSWSYNSFTLNGNLQRLDDTTKEDTPSGLELELKQKKAEIAALRRQLDTNEAGNQCASFTGVPVPCAELQRVRYFNRHVMPSLKSSGYKTVREEMTARGLLGHVWHVGHACPNPSKSHKHDREDYGEHISCRLPSFPGTSVHSAPCVSHAACAALCTGWNLFAQHDRDNTKLGHCLVSCEEAEYVEAVHVRCTNNHDCVRSCS
jgi:hypothetical protein